MAIGFVTCGPNTVLVISGCFHRTPTMIRGGRAFIWPFIQRCQKLPLKTMTLQIESAKVYTAQGVPISVTGIAQIKIDGQSEVLLLKACEQFLGQRIHAIENVAKETLEGHQRAIMGSMTVEEIYKDRKKFSQNVYDVASADLLNMGIIVISYTLKDISDDNGYLQALGMGRTAQVQRDARIGEADARRDAIIKQAIAEEQRRAAKYANDIEIARAKRDYELKKAAYDMEVDCQRAEAELAYSLQMAKTQQKVREEKMQVEVVERAQDVCVQEQEIQRRAKELDSTVKRPAEAEKFRLEKLAHANHNRVILEAEAEAEGIRLRGEAEAFAMAAKGKAEAEQLARKAEAYKLYEEAAMVDILLKVLPEIVSQVSTPLTQADKITMVSTGGEVGIAKLANEILQTVARMPELTGTMAGFDITKARLSTL